MRAVLLQVLDHFSFTGVARPERREKTREVTRTVTSHIRTAIDKKPILIYFFSVTLLKNNGKVVREQVQSHTVYD